VNLVTLLLYSYSSMSHFHVLYCIIIVASRATNLNSHVYDLEQSWNSTENEVCRVLLSMYHMNKI